MCGRCQASPPLFGGHQPTGENNADSSHHHRRRPRRTDPGPGPVPARDSGHGLRGRAVADVAVPGRTARHSRLQRPARRRGRRSHGRVPRPDSRGPPADADPRPRRHRPAGPSRRRHRRPSRTAARRVAADAARLASGRRRPVGPEGQRRPHGRRRTRGFLRRRHFDRREAAGRGGRRVVTGAASAVRRGAGVHGAGFRRDLPLRRRHPASGDREDRGRRRNGLARAGPAHHGPPRTRRPAHLRDAEQAGGVVRRPRPPRHLGRSRPGRGRVRRLGAGNPRADLRRRHRADPAQALPAAGRAPVGADPRG